MNEQSAITTPITRKYTHFLLLKLSPVFGALVLSIVSAMEADPDAEPDPELDPYIEELLELEELLEDDDLS